VNVFGVLKDLEGICLWGLEINCRDTFVGL
jgi:hypothetical protein